MELGLRFLEPRFQKPQTSVPQTVLSYVATSSNRLMVWRVCMRVRQHWCRRVIARVGRNGCISSVYIAGSAPCWLLSPLTPLFTSETSGSSVRDSLRPSLGVAGGRLPMDVNSLPGL